MTGIALLPLAALVTLGIEAPAQAQDGSLVAWHGCWREVVTEAGVEGPVLCILPGESAGEARMTPVVEGVPGPATVLRVDGVARTVEEGGCTGTESAQWSADGRRIFVRTELDCEGVQRVSTGVLAMINENEWVDVQAATVGGEYATRSRRYRAVSAGEIPDELRPGLPTGRNLVVEAARLRAARPLEIEDVIEASSRVAAPALQGLLAEQGQAFRLDGRSLVVLEEAGVAREVIDVVVALSYPQRFALRQPPSAEDVAERRAYRAEDCWDPWLRMRRYGSECDWLYSRYGYGYGRYGYGYDRWGYDSYGWNYNRPIVVVVRPDDGEPRRPGELVKGSGYSRGSAGGSGTAQPRGREDAGRRDDASSARSSSGSSGSTSSGSSSGSSSAGSSTSSRSSGSSSSSADTGRTAKPRGGGD